jgi:peptide subunit release factor RF-3
MYMAQSAEFVSSSVLQPDYHEGVNSRHAGGTDFSEDTYRVLSASTWR